MQELGGRRDRVARVEQAEAAAFGGGHEPPGERLCARDVPVGPRRRGRGLDLVRGREQLGRLAEVVARLERRDVRVVDLRLVAELLVQPVEGHVGRPAEHPRDQAEGEHVLRALGLLARQPQLLDRSYGDRGHRDAVDPVPVQRPVRERIGREPRLVEVALGERVLVDDDGAALLHRAELGLQGRRVHRDQDVRVIAGGQDVGGGELDLEGRHAVDRACGRSDLGREVREGREVVAQDRRRIGEPVAGQLHPVARVTGEPDDDALLLLDLLGHVLAGRGPAASFACGDCTSSVPPPRNLSGPSPRETGRPAR